MIRDIHGNVIPYGKTARTLEETFLGTTTLPSWLNVMATSGTPTSTIVPPSNDYGYLEVKTDAVAYDNARLEILPDGIDMTNFEEIIVELDSLVFSGSSTGNIYFFFDIAGDSWGVTVRPDDNSGNMIFRTKSGVTKTDTITNYQILNLGAGTHRRNIALRLRSDGSVVLLENGTVVAEKKFDPGVLDVNGLVYPSMEVQSIDGIAQWFRTSRVALTLIHN